MKFTIQSGIKLFLLCFLSMLFSFSCKKNTASEKEVSQVQKVKAIAAKAETLSKGLSCFGSISYQLKNAVTSQQGGELVYFPFKEGDVIKKNQVVARLKNQQLDFEREQYENNVETARSSLEVAENALREEELAFESRLLSLEKNKINIAQREVELEAERETLKKKKELFDLGAVTEYEFSQLQLHEKASQTDLLLMKKEYEISSLGLRDSDILAAGYEVPESESERFDLLLEMNTKSIKAKIEAAKVELKNARNALAAVKKLIQELELRSPIDGVVGTRDFEIGEYVNPNQSLLTVIDISSVYAVIFVQEKDMVNYSLGSGISIEIPSLQKKFSSVISEVSPVADSQSGNFAVKALVPNEDLLIKPGMFLTCMIENKNNETLVRIPLSSLLGSEGKEKVFLIRNDFLSLVDVCVRRKESGLAWLSYGLCDGDLIVDKPSPFLKEGQHVVW